MHPVATVFFLLGYGLALPVLFRVKQVVDRQHGIALSGHQVGMMLAAAGWLVRGAAALAFGHLVWAVALKLWFSVAGSRRRS